MNNNILKVLKYGHPILRKKVTKIVDFNGLTEFIQSMFNTMYEEKGIGLAANQVGKSINLMIADTSNIEDNHGGKYIFINSKIIKSYDSIIMEEGCLSVPDIRAEIKRPESIVLEYQDLQKNIHQKSFSGIVSRIIQHEMDHLNGKYFIDYLSHTKRMVLHKRLIEISKNGKPSTGIIL